MGLTLKHIRKVVRVPFSIPTHQQDDGEPEVVTFKFLAIEGKELRNMSDMFKTTGAGKSSEKQKEEAEYEAYFTAWRTYGRGVENFSFEVTDEEGNPTLDADNKPVLEDMSEWPMEKLEKFFRAEMLPASVNGDAGLYRAELFKYVKHAVLGFVEMQAPDYKFRGGS